MFEILDSILATAAIILGLAMIVQALQQIAKQMFDLKSSYMRTELLSLFTAEGEPGRFVTNLVPFGSLGRLADGFARRVVGELEERLTTFGLTDLHLLSSVDAQKLKELVSTLPAAHDTSLQGRFQSAMDGIEHWFDFSKQAYREHYERRMKLWSVILSAFVVVVLNANLLDTYKDFSHNKPLRDAAIALGNRFTALPKDSLFIRLSSTGKDSVVGQVRSDSLIMKTIRANLDGVRALLDERSFQVWGWTAERAQQAQRRSTFGNIIHSGVGWLAMLLVVSLGAPFWYDFFKMVTGVKDKLKDSKGGT